MRISGIESARAHRGRRLPSEAETSSESTSTRYDVESESDAPFALRLRDYIVANVPPVTTGIFDLETLRDAYVPRRAPARPRRAAAIEVARAAYAPPRSPTPSPPRTPTPPPLRIPTPAPPPRAASEAMLIDTRPQPYDDVVFLPRASAAADTKRGASGISPK